MDDGFIAAIPSEIFTILTFRDLIKKPEPIGLRNALSSFTIIAFYNLIFAVMTLLILHRRMNFNRMIIINGLISFYKDNNT